jgi:hypothetical protein
MPRSCLNWVWDVCTIYAAFYSSLISCAVTQEGQLPLRTPFQNWNWTTKRGVVFRSLKRHKHACVKWFPSVALLFVAPQTRSWKMVRFSRAPICGATNTIVKTGSLQSRSYLWRHKHACGKGPLILLREIIAENCKKHICYVGKIQIFCHTTMNWALNG